ncbi:LLM class flavin-dependent oxidoreductase [Sulfitobacter sp. F26204]|uniref:LLM class flavin-dependent oxidoreductase n=1 Tax=Sulfitobacter sp. F26204 TaxID=2996014 RepID=UPI00225DDFD5|nr:LLM class flavin-dependent oxidoreductase [Sulfitobacter sp. F26204]MCX7561449.1 LLM class flavin-dependent oxidoreductase [Sulfitobacter sp. F26204]
MKFGTMTQIQIPRPWHETSEREAYWNGLDQGVAAEAAGFEYFWITEQHFLAEIGHAAASDMFLAALSQRTKTLRMGLGVVVLPIHNPINVAERVACLDVLSNGRVEFGSGRGTTPYIVEGLGFDPAEGRGRGAESLEAILKMYDAPKFPGYKGEYYNLAAREILPRPIQDPHPPLWIAATNLGTYEFAGQQGFGVIGVTRNSIEETKAAVDKYRAAAASADDSTLIGRYANNQAAVFGIACCHDDDATGRKLACDAARWYYGDNDAELNHMRFATAQGGVEQIRANISKLSDDDMIEQGMAIGGNPDTICRQVEKWGSTGIDQMIFFMQAGFTTHDQVMRSIELIGEKVIPKFQS